MQEGCSKQCTLNMRLPFHRGWPSLEYSVMTGDKVLVTLCIIITRGTLHKSLKSNRFFGKW